MPSTRNGHHSAGQETPLKEVKGDGEDESSGSEDDSTSYDEFESEKRKSKCLGDMEFLEHQFSELKELLYQERIQDVEQKLHQLSKDSAPEYTNPSHDLQEHMEQRLKIADFLFDCKKISIQNKFEQETISAEASFEEGCEVIKAKMANEIKDRVQKLEEEKILSEIASENIGRKRKFKSNEFQLLEKRKKPVTVTGPYITYMLHDVEIAEDYNAIKKSLAIAEVNRRHILSLNHTSPMNFSR